MSLSLPLNYTHHSTPSAPLFFSLSLVTLTSQLGMQVPFDISDVFSLPADPINRPLGHKNLDSCGNGKCLVIHILKADAISNSYWYHSQFLAFWCFINNFTSIILTVSIISFHLMFLPFRGEIYEVWCLLLPESQQEFRTIRTNTRIPASEFISEYAS